MKGYYFKLLILVFFVFPLDMQAQETHELYGTVKNSKTNKPIANATIEITASGEMATTDGAGGYELVTSVSSGTYNIKVSAEGFRTFQTTHFIKGESILNISLIPISERDDDEDSTFYSENPVFIEDETHPSKKLVSTPSLKEMPYILAEEDVVRTLQALPGISRGNEGGTGLFIRGGNADQNLVLYDGVPLFNSGHVFGFFSVFEPEQVEKVNIHKGIFPARYGGRLSSVLDVKIQEGSKDTFGGYFALGLFTAKVGISGPIDAAGKTTYTVGGRRTTPDIFRMLSADNINNSDRVNFYFYDFNGKITHRLDNKKTLSLAFFRGFDILNFRAREDFIDSINFDPITESLRLKVGWGSSLASVNYTIQHNDQKKSNYRLSVSDYRLLFDLSEERIVNASTGRRTFNESIRYGNKITDYIAQADYEQVINRTHRLFYGASTTLHHFNPGEIGVKANLSSGRNIDTIIGPGRRNTLETAVYIEDVFALYSDVKGNLGMRLVSFNTGNGANQFFAEPRLHISKTIDSSLILYTALGRTHQFLHLVANSGTIFPTDLWLPATDKLKPMQSDQFNIGLHKKINPMWRVSVDAYYKWMRNVVDYREGLEIGNILSDWEERVASGIGKSYGVEILVGKTSGRLKGWLSQTFSKSTRQIEDVNFGRPFDFKYDRPVDLSLNISYDLNPYHTLMFHFAYATGNPITLPTGRYTDINGGVIYEYENKNGFRLRDYHRLDIGYHIKNPYKSVGARQTWKFSIYNVYARLNPILVFPDFESPTPTLTEFSLFNFIPGVTYQINF